MRKIRSNCYLSVFLRFELSFFLSIFFHILSWFLCIFSEMEEYIAHQLFYPRKKTFSHNSLLLETHNILTFSEWQKKHQQLQRVRHRQAVAFNHKIFTVQQTIYLKSVKSRIFYRDTKSSSLDDAKVALKLFFTNQRANNIGFGLWLSF